MTPTPRSLLDTVDVPGENGRRMEPVACVKCGALVSPQDMGSHTNFHFDLERKLIHLEENVRRAQHQ